MRASDRGSNIRAVGGACEDSDDFIHAGYVRRHLEPSNDRAGHVDANQGTFAMTKVVPQTVVSDTGLWERLEVAYRRAVHDGDHVVVVAGPLFEYGGAPPPRIGAHGVAVPSTLCKVALVLRPWRRRSRASRRWCQRPSNPRALTTRRAPRPGPRRADTHEPAPVARDSDVAPAQQRAVHPRQ